MKKEYKEIRQINADSLRRLCISKRWYAIAGYEVNPPDEWEEDLEEDEW